VVRDSAGVRIVTHRTIRNAPVAFTISPTPTIDLGGIKDDPKAELDAKNPFASAVRLSDGRYVASDYAWFKMFDAKGNYIRTVGRAGPGPGEFRQLRQVCLARGDTLIAIGYGDRRVSVFDSSGKHVRSFTTNGYQTDGACFGDGSIVDHNNPRVRPGTTMPPDRASRLDMIEDLSRTRLDGSVAGVVGWSFMEVFAGAQTIPNAFAGGELLYVGDGRTPEVRIYSIAGKLAQIIRWNDPIAKAPESAVSEVPVGASPRPPALTLGIVPAYAHLRADDAGRLWVQDYFGRQPQGWTVFAADGRLLGRVEPPAIPAASRGHVEIVGTHADHVVLAWRDEADGALHLAFHTLSAARR
jgi:hypothetical protein